MLVDKEGLWYRVLKVRYGEEGGWLKERGIVRCGEGCCRASVVVSGWGWVTGLMIMFVGWLVEGVAPTFRWITGWGEHLYKCDFPAYLIWLKTKG